MAALAAPSIHAQISVTALPSTDSADHLSIRVPAPDGSRVRLQVRAVLGSGGWVEAAEPVISTHGGVVDFLVPKGAGQPEASFYRALTETFVVRVSDDGKRYAISTPAPVPLAVLLDRVRGVTGLEVYPLDDPGDMVEVMVPAFSVESESLEEALGKAGVQVRVVPPLDEASSEFARIPVRAVTPPGAPVISGRPRWGRTERPRSLCRTRILHLAPTSS